jgi:hypothetical protein
MEITTIRKAHTMKFAYNMMRSVAALFLVTAAASASPITWTLNGVTLSDGGTASGTFTFNPDTGTACGSSSPCGVYSNVHIVTTNGTSRTGAIYSFVCEQDVAGCNGVSPDSTEVMLLSTNAANQAGNPALALFFTSIGALPPQGLTDAGGTIDISNSSGSVGSLEEGACANAGCSLPTNPVRFSTAGSVAAIPEPSTWLLLTMGLGVVGVRFRRS